MNLTQQANPEAELAKAPHLVDVKTGGFSGRKWWQPRGFVFEDSICLGWGVFFETKIHEIL